MSDLLSIGASGVRAYQNALTTTSENIANAGTAGYTRRAPQLREIAAAGGGVTSRPTAGGQGVSTSGIARSADEFRNAAVRTADTDLARTEAGAVWLERIEGALTGNQLGERVTSFFNAAQTLAADPTNTAARAAMLESGTGVAGAFAATGRALDQVASDLDAGARDATQTLDALGQTLARINEGLGRTSVDTAASAALADQRDSVLGQMSKLTDLSVSFDATGRAAVRLGGASGPLFVLGSDAGGVTFARNDEGAASFAVHRDGTTVALTPSGGALAGLAEGVARVADARAALDELAGDFADRVNTVQSNGRDLDGQPGAAMFAIGDRPTELSLALTDPRGIAAAAVGGGTRDNTNLQALQQARADGAFETRLTGLVSSNAATLAQRRTVALAQNSILAGAVTARDQVSGVNLDQEAVDLLRFQQAYQASSRVIQVARDTLQTILDIR